MTYGILLWGHLPIANKIFILQKRAVRLLEYEKQRGMLQIGALKTHLCIAFSLHLICCSMNLSDLSSYVGFKAVCTSGCA